MLLNAWSQAALNKGENSEQSVVSSVNNSNGIWESVELTSSEMNDLSLSENPSVVTPTNSTECSTSEDQLQDIDKKIRAIKKKVNLYCSSSMI